MKKNDLDKQHKVLFMFHSLYFQKVCFTFLRKKNSEDEYNQKRLTFFSPMKKCNMVNAVVQNSLFCPKML